jgi:hypothetical protein
MSQLKDRVDVVVLPQLASLERHRSSLAKSFETVSNTVGEHLKNAPRLVPFWIEPGEKPLHLHYARLGLFFTRSLKKIRRAYSRAAEATSS